MAPRVDPHEAEPEASRAVENATGRTESFIVPNLDDKTLALGSHSDMTSQILGQ